MQPPSPDCRPFTQCWCETVNPSHPRCQTPALSIESGILTAVLIVVGLLLIFKKLKL
jgi:hypothetical protein